MKILITGASGFIGSKLLKVLQNSKFRLAATYRSAPEEIKDFVVTPFIVGNINAHSNWSRALIGQEVVVHTAARNHLMIEDKSNILQEYRKVNVDGTLNLALQAVNAGVKRFIFISSIKVNGEQTKIGSLFKADDVPEPEDAYGITKLEAEQGLQKIAFETGLELVIIRPTIVYGPGVKGNFNNIVKLLRRELPLPFGAVNNKRSLIGLENLVDLIITCVDHPGAINQVFLASDGHDLSTTELCQKVCKAIGKSSNLIAVPEWLLRFTFRLIGKKAIEIRLLGSLQVDIDKAKDLLGWTPPFTVDECLSSFIVDDNRD